MEAEPSQATPPAAAAAALLSPAELAARGEAPVKAEYLRGAVSRVHVGVVSGQLGGAQQAEPGPAAPTVAAAGDGERQRDVRAKSKKQVKKERAQQRFSTSELCTMFALGKCRFSDCRFNHDVEAYLKQKPAELPGSCPFSAAEHCPYGITCRWASKHARPEELVQRFLLQPPTGEQQSRQEEQQEPQPQAADVGASGAAAVAAEGQQGPGAEPGGGQGGWWRRDGTIPRGTLELPVATEPPLEPVNGLAKDLQLQIRKGEYCFDKSDAVLASMGIRFHRPDKGQKGGCGGRGGRGGGRGRGQGGAPDAKRLRLEEGPGPAAAAPPGASAEADATAPAAAASDDAAFLGGLGTAAEAADCETAAAVAAGAAAEPAGAAHSGGDGGYVEAAPHPREKRTLDLRGKTFLAPLTTVGNLPFRRLCKGLGADVTCGEMALATNLLQGQPSEWALLKRHPSEDCFGVQLCGGFPDTMARCAQLIEDRCSVDFVDVNFGCPIDVVCGKGAGSACLLKPQRLEAIIKAMGSVLSSPLTFKMRKGYHDGHDIAHTLVPQAAGWGAAAVTLHGRTREQRYSRLADWPYIKRCVDAAAGTGLQLVGNGDVFSYEDHFRHLEECPGLATTYIARGALVKPWIFTEIKERRHWDISAGERLDFFKQFCSFGLEHWGSDSRGVETTRRFLLEWLSFTHRYIPVALLDVLPQCLHWRPPAFVGRSDLETLLASDHAADWVAISEMLLGPVPAGFVFSPKHKANSYARRDAADLGAAQAPAAAADGGAGLPVEQEEEY